VRTAEIRGTIVRFFLTVVVGVRAVTQPRKYFAAQG
jgi:hypothetical protein